MNVWPTGQTFLHFWCSQTYKQALCLRTSHDFVILFLYYHNKGWVASGAKIMRHEFSTKERIGSELNDLVLVFENTSEASEILTLKLPKRFVGCSDACKIVSKLFWDGTGKARKEISNFVIGVCFQIFPFHLICQAIWKINNVQTWSRNKWSEWRSLQWRLFGLSQRTRYYLVVAFQWYHSCSYIFLVY